MWSVSLRLFIYVGIILGIVAAASLRGVSSGNIIYEIGMNFALAGFAILILQVILAARFKWIERPVGFDILIRYHKYMALFAALLIIMHPLLLAAGGAGWRIIYDLDVPWHIWFGRIAFIIAIVNVLLSVYQGRIKLKFEKWRFTHDILGPSIIGLAFIHSLIVGDDLELRFMKIIWIAALALAVIIFSYHRIARPLILKNRPYRVIDVHPEAENVWTIKLAPPEGRTVNPYLPGQFHFITFYRGRNLPVEEHHWTISSSPAKKGYVTSTIKALGDFTATMGETRKGDKAAVHGAFGRFSYALHPEERDLVFIAGGIGITPLMSMLRHMRDTRDTRSVLLLYANSDRDHIVFMQELDQIEKNGRPSLKIVHVLSRAEESRAYEKGHIDQEKIRKYCGNDLSGKVFYVCGPPGMIAAVIESLKNLGVADRNVRLEIFTFVD